jgi:hypothetical protein
MQKRSATETKLIQTHPARPKLFLRWHLDPTTGKPVAQWTVEGKGPVSLVLRAAA